MLWSAPTSLLRVQSTPRRAYIIGRKALRDALKEMPEEYQRLEIDYRLHADPDDAFSTIPYEKGSNLLLHLERLVGGLDVFRPYIKAYVNEFSGKSITTQQWRDHLYAFFGAQKGGNDLVKKLDGIDWKGVRALLCCAGRTLITHRRSGSTARVQILSRTSSMTRPWRSR